MSYYSPVPIGVGMSPTGYMTPGYNVGAYNNPCIVFSPCCLPSGGCYPFVDCCGVCTGIACCCYCCR